MLIIPWMITLRKKNDVIIKEKIEYKYIEKHDTFQIEKPIPKYITKIKTDTIQVNESIFAEIPIERKVYEDTIFNDSASIHYKAEISGYKANLEGIWADVRTRQKEVLITQKIKEKPSRLQFGTTIGVGYGFINKKPDVFIGIGLSYRF